MKRDVVSAPMSFAGSAGRLANIAQGVRDPWLRRLLAWPTVVTVLAFAWTFILMWYLMFGLLLVPYRLIRRGSRRRKIEERRHAELLNALKRG
ncbi:MAG: hypothetical protein ACR2MP_34120 [Streptosporangiaceae bacterium]